MLPKKKQPNEQAPEPVTESKPFSCFSAPSEKTPSERKKTLRSEMSTVRDILSNSEVRRIFKLQATREYCVENVLFWEANEKFKKIKDEQERKMELEKIINLFLMPNSTLEVNTTKQMIQRVLEEAKSDVVSELVLEEITNDLEGSVLSDLYGRFRDSEEFKVLKRKGKVV
jgi:hypothetical protein